MEEYYGFKDALSVDICNTIIKLGQSEPTGKGGVINATQTAAFRDSETSWIREAWLYELLRGFMLEANSKAGWNFNLTSDEGVQFTKYDKGQHYHWHQDEVFKPYNEDGALRKLSLSANITNSNDYSGGDLQLLEQITNVGVKVTNLDEFKTQGSVIIFPSNTYHRVTPVTQGTRYSNVMWARGPLWQ